MFLWPKEIVGSLTDPFASMATSFTSSFEAFIRIKGVARLNLGGMDSTLDEEIIIHFNNDNCSVVKEKLIGTRNIILLPYLQQANSKDFFRSDLITYMPKLNKVDNYI